MKVAEEEMMAAPEPAERAARKPEEKLYFVLVGLVLLTGLYMRTANLSEVQDFAGDQGLHNLAVLDWRNNGGWPLLGPTRSVGDYHFGPGYFYLLALALFPTDFHPAAGAAAIALMGMAGVFLAWLWVFQTTRSKMAALATLLLLAWSAGQVERERCEWVASPLAAVTAVLIYFVYRVRLAPVSSFCALAMIAAIAPQWHTAALPVAALALLFGIWNLKRAWPLVAQTSRLQRAAWCAAAVLFVVSLYAPPLIHELQPGPGNLSKFIRRTFLLGNPAALTATAGKPQEQSLVVRVAQAPRRMFNGLVRLTAESSAFDRYPRAKWLFFSWTTALFLLVFVTRYRRVDPSVVFQLAVLAAFLCVLVLRPHRFLGHYLWPVIPVPPMLAGWTAGHLIARARERETPSALAGPSAWAILACLFFVAFQQLPNAWAIHNGAAPYLFSFGDSRRIADHVSRQSAGKPFGVIYIDGIWNYGTHFDYLLRLNGTPPQNELYMSTSLPREQMGENVFLVVRGQGLFLSFEVQNFRGPLPQPAPVGDALVFRIPLALIPDRACWIQALLEKRKLRLRTFDDPNELLRGFPKNIDPELLKAPGHAVFIGHKEGKSNPPARRRWQRATLP